MDHHANLVFFQAKHLSRRFVEDVIDDLHFEEMVSRAERAALVGASELGTIADSVWIGAVEAAVGLREVDVALRRQAAFLQVGRALQRHGAADIEVGGVDIGP